MVRNANFRHLGHRNIYLKSEGNLTFWLDSAQNKNKLVLLGDITAFYGEGGAFNIRWILANVFCIFTNTMVEGPTQYFVLFYLIFL